MVRPEPQGVAAGKVQQPVQDEVESGRQDPDVTLSRAAQVLSQEPSERGQGVIQSAEHASQVALGLRALFEGNGAQALASQAGKVSADIMGLLKAG